MNEIKINRQGEQVVVFVNGKIVLRIEAEDAVDIADKITMHADKILRSIDKDAA